MNKIILGGRIMLRKLVVRRIANKIEYITLSTVLA